MFSMFKKICFPIRRVYNIIFKKQVLFLSVPYYADEAGVNQLFKDAPATKERPFLVIRSDADIRKILLVNITSDKFNNSRQIFNKDYYLIRKYHPPL